LIVTIDTLLKLTVEKGASDLHLSAGTPPCLRIDGELQFCDLPPLTAELCHELCYSLLEHEQKRRFETFKELDFSHGVSGLGRFRVNYYYQRGSIGAAFRPILTEVPGFDVLGLPQAAVRKLASMPKGFVLVVGPTGSGKSTTLASMINYINHTQRSHIITIEDPIEYLFRHHTSVIHQREMGGDTLSFAESLKHVLRQDPDVVLVGEMRDLETVVAALNIAETGHLVFSTLHCGEAVEAISRVIDIFPIGQQQQVKVQLSLTLSGVIAQQLLPRASGKGRVLATEVMLVNTAIKNLIREGRPQEIYSHLQMGSKHGMSTMNQSLYRLYRQKEISLETALNASSNQKELETLIARG